MALRPAEGEREAVESAAGAGGSSAKDTEHAAGVFMVAICVAATILIRMGGLCGGPMGLLVLIDAANIFIMKTSVERDDAAMIVR